MGVFPTFMAKRLALHKRAAKRLKRRGLILRCEQCGKSVEPSSVEMEEYIHHGWPRCHGKQMISHTTKEINMNQELERKFEGIVEDAIAQASDIQCPKEEYIEGLEIMIDSLRIELQTAKEG